jgi:predicted nucleic acid-binding protein
MNAPALLVDSNVYIDLLRRGIDPSLALLEHFDTLNLATCGMVQLEVLRGVKSPRLQDRLRQFFSVMLYVPTDEKLWRDATRLAWELDRRGQVIPGPDALIAASALQLGADVVTADGRFDVIPGLRVRPPPPGLG